MHFPSFTLSLPEWVSNELQELPQDYQTVEQRMKLALRLAHHNVEHGSGGPFGAAVFDLRTATLLAPGVNLVVATHCSVTHAEIVAIILAQQAIGHYDLSAFTDQHYELVTTAEPCAMCLGAIPWSGIRSLVCGARDEDARSIGFDEGEKPADWAATLRRRGITVQRDVCRDEAQAVLRAYIEGGGEIYNARRS